MIETASAECNGKVAGPEGAAVKLGIPRSTLDSKIKQLKIKIILDWTPHRNCQQLDRLCNCIANFTAWLYSSKPVLHLRIRVQHAVVAQETNTHKSTSSAATG
jgi:hypothetical protein